MVALENNTTDNSGSANSGTSSVATGTGTETGTGKPRNRRVFAPHHPRDHSPRTPALGGATATAGRGKLRVAAEARRETTEAEVKAEEKAEAATELSNRKLTATTARESASGSGYTCGLWFLFHYLTGKLRPINWS